MTLGDGSREATVRLGSVARVPYPDAAMDVLCPMRTVRIPLDSFLAVNPLLGLGTLQSVTLRLAGRATGNVLFDDIELSR